MRYCESCEVPIGQMDPARLGHLQLGDCPYCGRALVKIDKPEPEEWIAATDVACVFRVSRERVLRLLHDKEMPHRTEGTYSYVQISECAKRWERYAVAG